MLREFATASEAEIWTRVRRRYLTCFARLHFENEPGLTELDAADGRQNRRLYLFGTCSVFMPKSQPSEWHGIQP